MLDQSPFYSLLVKFYMSWTVAKYSLPHEIKISVLRKRCDLTIELRNKIKWVPLGGYQSIFFLDGDLKQSCNLFYSLESTVWVHFLNNYGRLKGHGEKI